MSSWKKPHFPRSWKAKTTEIILSIFAKPPKVYTSKILLNGWFSSTAAAGCYLCQCKSNTKQRMIHGKGFPATKGAKFTSWVWLVVRINDKWIICSYNWNNLQDDLKTARNPHPKKGGFSKCLRKTLKKDQLAPYRISGLGSLYLRFVAPPKHRFHTRPGANAPFLHLSLKNLQGRIVG